MGLALVIAAPVHAQSAGAIEIGGFGRMQFHDKQLNIPNSVAPGGVPAGTDIDGFTRKYGYGFGGRLGVFFAENWSVEGGYHFVRQPSVRNTNLTLRALWNRPITEKFGYHVGLGALMNSYTLAPFTGIVEGTNSNQYYAGSDGVSDFGVAGLIGTRWKLTDMFAIRLDGTASLIPSPSRRRADFTRTNCGAPGTPFCVPAQNPEGADVNLGVELGGSILLNTDKDTDGDGIKDKKDTCPNTPKDVKVDMNGCPVDTDGDRIADYLDKCPNTPKGVSVDANGCPVDSDGDKIADYLDKCPNTPAGAVVDANGCPVDSDKDGVFDGLDRCPNTKAGAQVDATGCPRIFEEGKATLVLQGVNFATGTARLTPASRPILDKAAELISANPTIKIEVDGHTDNVGRPANNLRLSQQRADAVRNYLISKGVSGDQLVAKGFGGTQPIADNKTARGRAANRRVELKKLD
ncbi:MAG: OmpA family protein [Gemmatimonadaceae bacterium]|nr:OmpA family protein [Gemmatimonadaceae bacterium]